MPNTIRLVFMACLLMLILTTSLTVVTNDPVLPASPYDYATLNLPAHFTTNAGGPLPTSINGLDNTPVDNPITNHGATLGRVLFYDVNLSLNRTVSCGSCHKPANGFSDPSVLSVGFAGGTTRRHSMTLINARWYQRGRAFWDERAATIEQQVLQPFQDATEMGLTLTQLLERVSEQPYYTQLFTNAFGNATISSDRISKALAQFVRSIVSYQSKYDVGRAQVAGSGPPFPNFTAQENQGKNLFFQTIPNGGGACFGCHTTEGFVSANPGPQNNGLDVVSTTDLGAGEVFTQNPIFVGRFKTSTLRNIGLTAPYMHDGRFATLEQVVEHYNSGIQAHPTLSPALTDANNNPVRLNFTTTQKAALVAFLHTLTDNTLANEAKWSNPFPATVPVQLVDFSAKRVFDHIQLNWQTASEKDNDFFTVEKSTDAKTWENLAILRGAGLSTTIKNYSVRDEKLQNGIQFYRLKQTDFDGRSTYSKVVSVNVESNGKGSFKLYPNPVTNWVSIAFDDLPKEKDGELRLVNSAGQVVLTQKITDISQQQIDISRLPKGVYWFNLTVGNRIWTQQLVKN
jgi:cytochrome c peroxidase